MFSVPPGKKHFQKVQGPKLPLRINPRSLEGDKGSSKVIMISSTLVSCLDAGNFGNVDV